MSSNFSTIAQSTHRYFSPLSEAKAKILCEFLDPNVDDKILDIGCGKATLLMDLLSDKPCRGLGIDSSEEAIAIARDECHRRGLRVRLELRCAVLAEETFEEGEFGTILCVGASQTVGTQKAAIKWIYRHLKPGGTALFADGFWQKVPAPEYLEFLGAKAEEMKSHAANAQMARDAGFVLLYTATSSQDEWDEFEGRYCGNVERYVAAHPDDPESKAVADRIRSWNAGYLAMGRDTLGFGFYVLMKPNE